MDTLALSADSAAPSRTQVITHDEIREEASQPVLRLRLKKPKSDKKVGWHEGTVDNEHMGKKKSKCCCVYKKPTKFGESSSEDDEECENCFGHPEKRRKNRKHDDHDHHNNYNPSSDGEHKEEPPSNV